MGGHSATEPAGQRPGGRPPRTRVQLVRAADSGGRGAGPSVGLTRGHIYVKPPHQDRQGRRVATNDARGSGGMPPGAGSRV
eukprot:scaffold87114_cov64-Phaeocystis_antarctica.AAC.2